MDETFVVPPGGAGGPPPDVADLDEKVLGEAVRRGLITPAQGRAALEEARTGSVSLLEVLVRRGLLDDAAAKDLDEEMKEDFVPGYRVLRKLGEGGMGVVYLALQKRLDREVALKVVTPGLAADASYLRRFEREAKAVARLNHPCIVAAYDYGESRGRVFLAMEFVDGVNCADEVRANGPMTEARALAVVRDVASGLAHAQAAGIIHRDIKPANLLLAKTSAGHTASGTAAGAKVTDLGLARSGDGPGASDLTAQGTILGTPGYMAPEQAFGKDIDHRADIYALGATLYQLVTGIRPFEASTPVAVIARQQTDRLPDPRDLRPELSPALVALLQGMMAREPQCRYAQYRDLLDDIDRVRRGEAPFLPAPPVEHRSIGEPDDSGIAPAPSGGTVILSGGGAAAATRIQSPGADAASAPAGKKSPAGFVAAGVVVAGVVVAFMLMNGGGDDPPKGTGGDPASSAPAGPGPAKGARGAVETRVDEALAAGDTEAAVILLVAVRRSLDALPEPDRSALAAKSAAVDAALDRFRAREADAVGGLWKEGKYDEALDRVITAREIMGSMTGEKLDALHGTLAGIGARGAEERTDLTNARAAFSRGDSLVVLEALDGFEAKYPFSPDLAQVKDLRARAEEMAPVVHIDSRPVVARILLDDLDRGTTPFQGRVAAGKVKLRLEAKGYEPLERVIDVMVKSGFSDEFALEPLPEPDPVPAVVLEREGNPLPLWTGGNVGAWNALGGSWGVSDTGRMAILEGEPTKEPPAQFRGQAASTVARTERDVAKLVAGAAGWRLEFQMVGCGRTAGETSRVELHFALAADGRALVLGIDDQDVYIGQRDPATGQLARTHRLKGVAANHRHTFVVENHGGVYRCFADGRSVGAVKGPDAPADGVPLRLAVEGGAGLFSDITLQKMAAPK